MINLKKENSSSLFWGKTAFAVFSVVLLCTGAAAVVVFVPNILPVVFGAQSIVAVAIGLGVVGGVSVLSLLINGVHMYTRSSLYWAGIASVMFGVLLLLAVTAAVVIFVPNILPVVFGAQTMMTIAIGLSVVSILSVLGWSVWHAVYKELEGELHITSLEKHRVERQIVEDQNINDGRPLNIFVCNEAGTSGSPKFFSEDQSDGSGVWVLPNSWQLPLYNSMQHNILLLEEKAVEEEKVAPPLVRALEKSMGKCGYFIVMLNAQEMKRIRDNLAGGVQTFREFLPCLQNENRITFYAFWRDYPKNENDKPDDATTRMFLKETFPTVFRSPVSPRSLEASHEGAFR